MASVVQNNTTEASEKNIEIEEEKKNNDVTNNNNNHNNVNNENNNNKNVNNIVPIEPIVVPETEEEKKIRKEKERNLLRSQIYFGDLGKLTAAEAAQKRAKEKLAKASENAKKFLKVFAAKEDTKLPFAIIGVPHQQEGGFYSAKEIADVKQCPNYSKDSDIHKCTEYCRRRYGPSINQSTACLLQ